MDTLIKLTNPEFPLEFAGVTYNVRKANLDKVVKYMQRMEEYRASGEPATVTGPKIISYCVWLILSTVKPDLTEQEVYDNIPGDVDATQLLVQLGFLNPKRAEMGLKTTTVVQKPAPISEPSLPLSPTEQDGTPTKSETSA